MKLIVQQERWTCGLASIAMLLDEEPEKLMMEIGHNGGKILWPELPEPLCYQGFHRQELIDLCYDRGFALVGLESQPVSVSTDGVEPKHVWPSDYENSRISRYMEGVPGILVGQVERGHLHAVAWDGERVFDPRGHVYRFQDSEPEQSIGTKAFYPIAVSEFLMLLRIKS